MKTIFDLCVPRPDVLAGRLRDEEFAADLGQVVAGKASAEYGDPERFFRHTHPTKGLKTLLETVCRRLSDTGGELNAVCRLDTQFGGGKTHSLIALVHAVQSGSGLPGIEDFVDSSLLPTGPVRIAALSGENSDPANGLKLEKDLYARSLWGEMAYRLAGRAGFERVSKSDENHVAPGSDTLIELFGDQPCLILIDEIAVYLRKIARVFPDATNQFTAFAQALFKAVSASPKVSLVYTLAVRADDKEATDAYRIEQQIAMAAFDEAESVSGRKATQLNPTEEDETVFVLKRRLFERIDVDGAIPVIAAYRDVWKRNADSLSDDADRPETTTQFERGYPLHPELLSTLIEKTSSLNNFQRTRGMLRLLARTVYDLWQNKPTDATAIHPHHINPGVQAIRDEITTRLGQGQYTPAIAADVSAVSGMAASVAQSLDEKEYAGQPPVTSYVARTILLHSLAFPDGVRGVLPDCLRFSVCSPVIEPAFVEAARRRFIEESLFLDDRPGAPMRFMTEANLTQLIRKATNEVEPHEIHAELGERIRDLFAGRNQPFDPIFFPAGPYEVPDEIGEGRPFLIVLNYDAAAVAAEPTSLPSEILEMATRKGTGNEFRTFQNNLVFVVADQGRVSGMKETVKRRLGLKRMTAPDRMRDLAGYQQEQVKEEFRKSDVAASVQVAQCYRHLFYPSNNPLAGNEARLAHTVISLPSAAEHPGNCQRQIHRALRDQKKVLSSGDAPDAPAFVRDQTPLKVKGEITTLDLRNEFRRAPNLSILLGDEPLTQCIRQGIDSDVFIYRVGDQVFGKGDPTPVIQISDNAFVYTMSQAKQQSLWPRKPKPADPPAGGSTGVNLGGSGATTTAGGTTSTGGATGGATTGPGTTAPSTGRLTATGPLRQALTKLFEQARSQKIEKFATVRIRLFGHKDTWDVHQAVATFNGATSTSEFSVVMQADGIEELALEFRGNMQRANTLKSNLTPLLQTATDARFEGAYTLKFNAPLATDTTSGETFIKAMTKYGGGEAYVEAEAAAKD